MKKIPVASAVFLKQKHGCWYLLVLQKTEYPKEERLWRLPGGKYEPTKDQGSTVKTMRREAEEEAGLLPAKWDQVAWVRHKGGQHPHDQTFFLVFEYEGELKDTEDVHGTIPQWIPVGDSLFDSDYFLRPHLPGVVAALKRVAGEDPAIKSLLTRHHYLD